MTLALLSELNIFIFYQETSDLVTQVIRLLLLIYIYD